MELCLGHTTCCYILYLFVLTGSPQLRPLSTATSAASSRSASPSLCSTGEIDTLQPFEYNSCSILIFFCSNRKWQHFFHWFTHTKNTIQNQFSCNQVRYRYKNLYLYTHSLRMSHYINFQSHINQNSSSRPSNTKAIHA